MWLFLIIHGDNAMRFLGKKQEKSLGSTCLLKIPSNGSVVRNWFCRKAHPFYSKGLIGNTDNIDFRRFMQTSTNVVWEGNVLVPAINRARVAVMDCGILHSCWHSHALLLYLLFFFEAPSHKFIFLLCLQESSTWLLLWKRWVSQSERKKI